MVRHGSKVSLPSAAVYPRPEIRAFQNVCHEPAVQGTLPRIGAVSATPPCCARGARGAHGAREAARELPDLLLARKNTAHQCGDPRPLWIDAHARLHPLPRRPQHAQGIRADVRLRHHAGATHTQKSAKTTIPAVRVTKRRVRKAGMVRARSEGGIHHLGRRVEGVRCLLLSDVLQARPHHRHTFRAHAAGHGYGCR